MCGTLTKVSQVAIVGMGVRSCFGRGADALLDGLIAGRPAFVRYAPFVAAGLRAPFAAPVDDGTLRAGVGQWDDRCTALLEGAVRDALEDATGERQLEGLGAIAPQRVGLVVGTSSSGIGPFCHAIATGVTPERNDARYGAPTRDVGALLGVQGPLLTVCNVCASGSMAIAEAARMVHRGQCDVVVAVGADALEPFVGAGFDSLGALTERPLPFALDRRGLTLGEGAAAVVLANVGVLGSRVHARIAGWGASSDAHHLTAPDPRGGGVALAIRRALSRAGISADRIDAVHAHATGTPFNDAMECAALRDVFGERARTLPVYGIKGTIGHTLGAAGAIESVASVAAMARGLIPPTVTSESLDPACDVGVVRAVSRDMPVHFTLKLSSAFGGANCALVICDA